jgi:hypothetical protein
MRYLLLLLVLAAPVRADLRTTSLLMWNYTPHPVHYHIQGRVEETVTLGPQEWRQHQAPKPTKFFVHYSARQDGTLSCCLRVKGNKVRELAARPIESRSWAFVSTVTGVDLVDGRHPAVARPMRLVPGLEKAPNIDW